MKKLFFFAAIAAAALSSCSSDELVQAEQPVEDGAVAFGAYVGRDTRAIMDQEALKASGFGVFAYDQGAKSYTTYSSSSSYPNFMYNQKVAAPVDHYAMPTSIPKTQYDALTSGSKSTYFTLNTSDENVYDCTPAGASITPTSYEALDNDLKALCTAVLSASAWEYSPVKYFNNNEGAKHSFFAYAPYDKSVKSIFTLGNAPAIRYSAATDNYDLLWAKAIMDIEKPGVTHTLDFNFQHALSKVDIKVAPFVDKVHGDATHVGDAYSDVLDGNTTIKVRSIKFVGTVASQALLNLQNGTWNFEATEESAYEINDEITLTNAYNTKAEANYYPVISDRMVIPTLSGKPVRIQIVYDVITVDGKNSVNNSTITNTITSEETFNLVQGKAYKFYLDLGMTSVKFNADVVEWGTANGNNVDLPNNHYYTLLSDAPRITEKLTSAVDLKVQAYNVGDIVVTNDLKAYEYTKKYVSPSTYAEYRPVTAQYLIDATNHKVYVYDAITGTYTENTANVATDIETVAATSTAAYYYVGDKYYVVVSE